MSFTMYILFLIWQVLNLNPWLPKLTNIAMHLLKFWLDFQPKLLKL